MRLQRVLLTAASVAALTATANAADMYGAPAADYVGVNWTGFYGGVNGGGAWAENENLAVPGLWSGVSPAGAFGGGQFGYNIQGILGRNVVLGVETDIQGGGISDSVKRCCIAYSSDLDWFGTVRGRVGYGVDRALVYFTGGFAYGGIKNEVNYRSAGNPSGWDYRFDGTATGYVIGGGVEYKFTPRWSVKAEYQYIDLGKNDPTSHGASWGNGGSYTGPPSNPIGPYKNSLTEDAFHTVRAGVNYSFGQDYAPLK